MKIKSWHMGLIVLVFIFGGIAGTMAFNLWNTEGGGSSRVPITFKVGEFAGEYNPADIRGSYSFGHISELWEIPLTELGTAFGLEAIENLADLKCNTLEAAYANLEADVEIGTDSVRVFVAFYTGLPYLLSDTTYLPQPAVDILKAKAKLIEEQIVFLDSHSVDISSIEIIDPATLAGACDCEEEHEELKIKGKTTFRESLDCGLSEEEIGAVIGGELPSTGMTIRDFVAEKGLYFDPIKEQLQAKVDALGAK